MELEIETQVSLPKVRVQVAAARWDGASRSDASSGYYLCQRISGRHGGIRVGSPTIDRAFTRVSSVGLLSPFCSVDLHPVDQPLRTLNCVYDKRHFEDTTQLESTLWSEYADAFLTIRNGAIEATMRRIHRELLEPGFAAEMLIDAASTSLLVEMSRHVRAHLGRGRRGAAVGGMPGWQLRRINERIAASLEIGYPDLAELAGLCGISESHLMRTFKATTGQRIHEHIATERMAAARDMLAADTLSLKEIAARLGFCDQSYFATAFRRTVGLTPREYRRRAQLG